MSSMEEQPGATFEQGPGEAVSEAVGASPVASPVASRIAEEVASLATLSELPLSEHADAYQRVHAELQRALAEIDGA